MQRRSYSTEMESRKIQKVGGGTYTVSLPKEWAEAENCTAGTVVDLHSHIDGVLVIQTPEAEAETHDCITIEIESKQIGEIEQFVRAAYVAGVQSITLRFIDGYSNEQIRDIRRVKEKLTGVTISEASENLVRILILIDAEEVSITQSVRQLQFVSLSMHRDAIATVSDELNGTRWDDRDNQADRLYAVIDRHFERGLARLDEIDALGLDRSELFGLWMAARELERVADHAERIGTTAGELTETPPQGLSTDLDTLSTDALDIVEKAVSVVVEDASANTAKQALVDYQTFHERVTAVERELFQQPDADYRLVQILDSLRRTGAHGSNIAEIGLRIAIRDGTLASVDPATDTTDSTTDSDYCE